MQTLDLAFPKVDAEQRKQLELARAALEGEKGGRGMAKRAGKASKAAGKTAKPAKRGGEPRPGPAKPARGPRVTPVSGGPAVDAGVDVGAPDQEAADDRSA